MSNTVGVQLVQKGTQRLVHEGHPPVAATGSVLTRR